MVQPSSHNVKRPIFVQKLDYDKTLQVYWLLFFAESLDYNPKCPKLHKNQKKKNQSNDFSSGFVKDFWNKKWTFATLWSCLTLASSLMRQILFIWRRFFHAFYAAPGFGRTIGSTNFMTHGIFRLFQHDCIHCFCLFIRLPYRPGIDNYYAKKIGYLLIWCNHRQILGKTVKPECHK